MAIPTNLITGFLGVGKTTAVIDLLKHKPANERWAVLVNEYGEVSIDGAMIEGSGPEGVTVQEVAGGCVCCASAPYLPVALHFLLLDARPDRLIIETTGLGHPARLLDTLRSNYADRLELRAVLGLVDPRDFARPEMRQNPIFLDQIQLADVVILNKLDTAPAALVSTFQEWANTLFPPKLLIAGTTYGHIEPSWLDLVGNDERLPLYPEAHDHLRVVETLGETEARPVSLTAGSVCRYPSPKGIRPACCGWLFSPEDVFSERKLLALFGDAKAITRLKGVFRLPDDWVSLNRVGQSLTVTPTAYRRDSRLEVFAEDLNWIEFEEQLLACRLNRRIESDTFPD